MKHKTIELIIKTDVKNEEILEIFDNLTSGLKNLGVELLEIRVVGSANSLIRGIDYSNDINDKK